MAAGLGSIFVHTSTGVRNLNRIKHIFLPEMLHRSGSMFVFVHLASVYVRLRRLPAPAANRRKLILSHLGRRRVSKAVSVPTSSLQG